jgi:cell wall-associated NlpC family hydrolase
MRKFNTARQVFVLASILLALMTGCATTSVPVSPSATPATGLDNSNLRERLNHHYLAWRGVPYKTGGNDKRGIDCSGFVHLAYKNTMGITVPRSTKLLSKTGIEISRKQLAVGDLVFFKTGLAKQHVGIYIGNSQFIHASTSKGVMKSNLKSPYWSKHYWKSTRVIGV